MWSRIVVISLALGVAKAFTSPVARAQHHRVASSASVEDKISELESAIAAPSAEKPSIADPSMEAATEKPMSNSPKVSNFKPRDRSKWSSNAGYSKYGAQSESEAYDMLQKSKIGQIDALQPLIEKTKERPALLDGTHAGDIGFDPMGYASSDELLYFYLESEVKHGRLAMLGALGWIGAELANDERAPNVLNGHIFQPMNFLGVFAAFTAWSYLEHQVYPAQYIEHTPNNGKHNYLHYMDGPYVAGNLEFDPLNLYSALGDDAAGRRAMRELEVAHGRYAMLGLTSWVALEAVTGVPVTQLFAVFFKPFWQWGLPVLGENAFVGTLEFSALCAAGAFAAYQSVMEIDSMKYQGDGDPDYTFFPKEGE